MGFLFSVFGIGNKSKRSVVSCWFMVVGFICHSDLPTDRQSLSKDLPSLIPYFCILSPDFIVKMVQMSIVSLKTKIENSFEC